jgi:hypothetical protein
VTPIAVKGMRRATAWLLVTVLTSATLAAEGRHAPPAEGPVAAAAAGAIAQITRSPVARPVTAPPDRLQPPSQPGTKQQGNWIARHPALFGSLVGFAVGCPLGASQVGGSKDTFFNALDEFACPVIGGVGAAAGALIGWSIGRK